jgi:NO-binding membrane sensor protein with MHYT domain
VWKILTCLTTQHDWRLVLVAALVCLTASLTSFRLYGRVAGASGGARLAWLAFTGFTAGAGTWATHFIAMLAYHPLFRTGYLPFGTAASG